jgi:hypothetical protein
LAEARELAQAPPDYGTFKQAEKMKKAWGRQGEQGI